MSQKSEPSLDRYQFTYDMQINNVMDIPVTIVRHSWSISEYHLSRSRSLPEISGPGLGGYRKTGDYLLEAGQAVRIQGGLTLSAPIGTVEGYLVVELERGAHGPDQNRFESLVVKIGRFGLSVHNSPVEPRREIGGPN